MTSIRPPQRPGRVLTSTAALSAAVLVAAAASASSAPDRDAEQAAAFDRTYAAAQGWFTGERDEQGTSYRHLRYTSPQEKRVRTVDLEIDYARMGRGHDIALLRRDRLARPGFSLDFLHTPGSDEDLVLLGDRYRQPADGWVGEPTPWIARPTVMADSGGWNPCATASTSLVCDLDKAVAATRKALPDVPRTYQQTPDGTVTARTGIRLLDLVAYDLVGVNASQLALLQTELDTLVPLTITVAPDGTFTRLELNGRLTTPSATIEMQLGVEHRGDATAADFPAPPTDPRQIRHVGRVEYGFFIQAATKYAIQQAAAADASTPH